MVLCLLRASYNVTIADADAVFLSDASSWLSGFDLVASRRRRNQHRTRRVCSTAWGSTRRAQTRHRRSRGNFPEWCSERWGASLCLGLARFNTGVHVTSLTKHLVERTAPVRVLRDDQLGRVPRPPLAGPSLSSGVRVGAL